MAHLVKRVLLEAGDEKPDVEAVLVASVRRNGKQAQQHRLNHMPWRKTWLTSVTPAHVRMRNMSSRVDSACGHRLACGHTSSMVMMIRHCQLRAKGLRRHAIRSCSSLTRLRTVNSACSLIAKN